MESKLSHKNNQRFDSNYCIALSPTQKDPLRQQLSAEVQDKALLFIQLVDKENEFI